MKICLMSSSCEWQACASQIYVDYANHFVEQGHDVTLMFFRRFRIESRLDERVNIVFSPKWISWMKGPNDFNPFEVMFRTVKVLKGRHDIIHVCPGHRPAFYFPAVFSKRIFGSSIVDEWWEWFGNEGLGVGKYGLRKLFARIDNFLELRTKQSFDLIFPITTTLENRLPESMQKKSIVLHGGMDADHFVQYGKTEARQATGLDEALIVVGLSNTCDGDHEDNLPFFKAFKKSCAKHPRLRLLVSGNKNYIENTLLPMIGKERVINIGWQPLDAFNRYLSACDFFALPFPDTARNRGRWPNKLTDYVWLKRPVVTNKTGELKSIVEENALGFCCEHTEDGYEKVLGESYGKAERGELPTIDSENCGLLTTQQRREEILGYYGSLRARGIHGAN